MSNPSRLKSLQKEIAALNDDDAKVLYRALQLRERLSSKPSVSQGSHEQLYDSIREEVRRQLHLTSVHYPTFRKKDVSAKAFNAAAVTMDEYILSWYPDITALHKKSLYGLAAQLIVSAARRFNKSEVPIWRIIPNQMKNFPALMEDAFPGYLASKLMQKVLEHRIQGDSTNVRYVQRR